MSNRTGITLCYPLELKRLNTWLSEDSKVIIQPKYDGDRCRALLTNSVTLISSEGHDRNFALPHIAQAIEKYKKDFISRGIFELDGELYKHGWKHEDIHSVCSRAVNRHPDYMQIEYHIFDHIAMIPQHRRITELYGSAVEWNNTGSPLKLAPTVVVTSETAVMDDYRIFVDAGYEGIITRRWAAHYKRSRSTDIMKFKGSKEDIYKIVGYLEEISIRGERKNSLGALICVGTDGNEFNVGTGFTQQDRIELWKMQDALIGMYAVVKYQHMTTKHVPRFPVIVEVLNYDTAVENYPEVSAL